VRFDYYEVAQSKDRLSASILSLTR